MKDLGIALIFSTIASALIFFPIALLIYFTGKIESIIILFVTPIPYVGIGIYYAVYKGLRE